MGTTYSYYVAATLDGFIADDADGLSWLLDQDTGPGGLLEYDTFLAGVGAVVMGRATYDWLLRHDQAGPGRWPYEQPTFLFTRSPVTPVVEGIRVVAGDPADHREALVAAAGDGEVWIVGGGGLALQFARAGMLDRLDLSLAPVTLGAGRPLVTGGLDLALSASDVSGAFLQARYEVLGVREPW